MYVCMYVYRYIFIYIYIYLHTHTHTHTHTQTHPHPHPQICGAIPHKQCRFFSFTAATKECLLFSACPPPLSPRAPSAAAAFTTYAIPYERFEARLECKVRVILRGSQLHVHVYDCGGSGGGVRRSLQEVCLLDVCV